jgi:sialidase-1
MKSRSFLLAILASTVGLAAEPQFSDVFMAGKDGYPSIRIPSVVVTTKGTVLAFAEGRQKHSDQAENDIVMKRSTDGGVTWSPLKVIQDDGANSLNNPTALVASSGRIFLLYQRIPARLKEHSQDIATGFAGENIYRSLLVTSDDDGQTWSAPRDVTRGTKHETSATTIASGPGIGIELTRGPHQGRLVMPFNEGPYWKWNNYAAFSDDAGQTWQCGANVPGALVPDAKLGERSQINEVQMVELSDGGVRLHSRQFAGAKVRKTSISRDGGATWSAVEDVPALRDPCCMASIFRFSFDDAGGHGRVLYSGPDSTKRENGTVHLSTDDGATWPTQRVLWPGSFGYSVLTKLPNGTVGCLFETDNADRIVLARFPIEWISEK